MLKFFDTILDCKKEYRRYHFNWRRIKKKLFFKALPWLIAPDICTFEIYNGFDKNTFAYQSFFSLALISIQMMVSIVLFGHPGVQ